MIPDPVPDTTPDESAKMDKRHCVGCYNNDYNHGLGGASECWSLKTAQLIKRKRVHINHVPPWNQAPETLPSCYRETGFVFVSPERTC